MSEETMPTYYSLIKKIANKKMSVSVKQIGFIIEYLVIPILDWINKFNAIWFLKIKLLVEN